MSTLIGILLGLSTAVSVTFAYAFTRLFVIRSRQAVVDLLIAAHLLMGATSAAMLLVMRPDLPPFTEWAGALAGASGFYLIAQTALLTLMRITNPSRVAPLLGIKIIVLAALAVGVFGESLTALQWLAVFLCGGSALLLQAWGGSLGLGGLALLATAVCGYALSDLHIGKLVAAVAPGQVARGPLVAIAFCYLSLGIIAIPGLVFLHRRGGIAKTLRLSVPYSATWFGAMLCFFACISLLGTVYAVLLQSMRGPLSILAGAWIAKQGYAHIETTISRSLLWRRIAAAALMILAVWLFQIG